MLTNDTFQLDRRIYQQAESLVEIGYQVIIVYFHRGLPLPADNNEKIKLLCADLSDGRSVRQSFWQKIKSKLAGSKMIVTLFQYGQSYSSPNILHLSSDFIDVIPAETNVIVAHDLPALPAAFELKKKIPDVKVVFDAHEYYEEQLDTIFSTRLIESWRQISKRFIPMADELITVTQDIAQRMKSDFGLDKDFHVLPNAHPYVSSKLVSESRGKLRNLYNLTEDSRVILCCGGVTEGRNLEDFILAGQYLPEDVVICFVGYADKSYLEKLVDLVNKHTLQDKVKIGKAVSPDQVVTLCCGANLGVISNRGEGANNTEGCPNRLYEYIQARVPVFSYEHFGVRELLELTGTGLIASWKNEKELAEQLLLALENATKIEQEVLEKAAFDYSWDQIKTHYQSIVAF